MHQQAKVHCWIKLRSMPYPMLPNWKKLLISVLSPHKTTGWITGPTLIRKIQTISASRTGRYARRWFIKTQMTQIFAKENKCMIKSYSLLICVLRFIKDLKLCETPCNSVVSLILFGPIIRTHLNIGTANHFLNIFVTSTYITNAEKNPTMASIR